MSSDKNYFSHDADIGIIGYGDTLEHSFIDAAVALFSLMTDLSQLNVDTSIHFAFDEQDIEFAFITWLNLLIAKAQTNHLVFSQFHLTRIGDLWQAEAKGTSWKREFERRIEVKGATLTMLSVKQLKNGWESKCVVDV